MASVPVTLGDRSHLRHRETQEFVALTVLTRPSSEESQRMFGAFGTTQRADITTHRRQNRLRFFFDRHTLFAIMSAHADYREFFRYRMDADCHRTRAGDDPRPRILLRRNGTRKKCPKYHDDVIRRPRLRWHRVGTDRLLARIRRRQWVSRRSQIRVP